jgi:hypothetical protein
MTGPTNCSIAFCLVRQIDLLLVRGQTVFKRRHVLSFDTLNHPEMFRPSARPSAVMLLGIAGSAAVWFSHPVIFVIGDAFLVLLVDVMKSTELKAARLRRLFRLGLAASFVSCQLRSALCYIIPVHNNDDYRGVLAGFFYANAAMERPHLDAESLVWTIARPAWLLSRKVAPLGCKFCTPDPRHDPVCSGLYLIIL